ncbi:hypothetical protein ABPG72_014085 [Tetrahymena utriculariae]
MNKKCLNCDQSCYSCFGLSKYQCTQCNKDYYFQSNQSRCTKKCESITLQEKDQLNCIKCENAGCEQCQQSNICTKCFQHMDLSSDGLCQQNLGAYCNFINEHYRLYINDNIMYVFASSAGNIILIYEYYQVAVECKCQFLYGDYKPQFYYWYKVKLFFKSIIMTASILLVEQPQIRTFAVNIVLVSFCLLSTRKNPYISDQRNKLEQQSIFISIFTINLTILTILYQGFYEFNPKLSQYVTVFIYTLNNIFILKLLIIAYINIISADLQKQNCLQQLLYQAREQSKISLDNQVIQKQNNNLQAIQLQVNPFLQNENDSVKPIIGTKERSEILQSNQMFLLNRQSMSVSIQQNNLQNNQEEFIDPSQISQLVKKNTFQVLGNNQNESQK